MTAQLEAVLFDLVLEGAAADAQKFGRLRAILIRFIEGIDDHLLLGHVRDRFHFFLKWGGGHRWIYASGIKGHVWLEDIRREKVH